MMIVFQSCGGKEEKRAPEATVSKEEVSESEKDLSSFIYPRAVKAKEEHISGIVNYLTTDDFETVRKYYLNLSGKKVSWGGSVDTVGPKERKITAIHYGEGLQWVALEEIIESQISNIPEYKGYKTVIGIGGIFE